MQSQGSTSSQPSFDSLSSSDSLLLSDSDQVEDDTDVFLTDGSSSGRATTRDGGSESPGSQWTCDVFTDKEEEEESYRSESGGKPADITSHETDRTAQGPESQGDLLFAQKCAELQGFVRPLLELLNGLKKGRFDRGLSSFQQSVAMDRIQRIVGVLQRPDIGEKYLNTLLQVEVMLKLWFPQIRTPPTSTASSVDASPARTSNSTPPHKHRDQLHIPVKKRRLSWTGTDTPTPSAVLLWGSRIRAEGKRMKPDQNGSHDAAPPPPPLPPSSVASDADQNTPRVNGQQTADTKGKDTDSEGRVTNYKAGQSSEPSLTWVHVAPILSPRTACPSHEVTNAAGPSEIQPIGPVLPLNPATQDSSVSSTTAVKHPKNLQNPIRCQSQPAAEQQIETAAACQREQQSPPVALEPLPGACPAPLET